MSKRLSRQGVTDGSTVIGAPVLGTRGARAGLVSAGLVAVVLLSGCGASTGSGGAGSAPAPGSSPGSSAAAGAVNPNAPEVIAAGDIPDNQVYVPYTDPGGVFTVSVPQGWARSAVGSATVFTDKFNSVRIESQPRPTAPDAASATAQEVPALQASVPGFVLGHISVVPRTAGPAVLITYDAASARNAVTGKSITEAVERYTFWRNGRQVVLTLSGAKGADNVDPWRKVTDSFGWTR